MYICICICIMHVQVARHLGAPSLLPRRRAPLSEGAPLLPDSVHDEQHQLQDNAALLVRIFGFVVCFCVFFVLFVWLCWRVYLNVRADTRVFESTRGFTFVCVHTVAPSYGETTISLRHSPISSISCNRALHKQSFWWGQTPYTNWAYFF